ncbi:hypothetical protein [Leucobacter sp. GX24907]
MVLKYTSKRPDEELDGLQAYEEHFKSAQHDDVLAVVVISGHTLVEDLNDGMRTATVRMKQVEPLSGDAAQSARRLLSDAYVKRTGNQALEFDEFPPEQPTLTAVEAGDSE